MIRRVETAGVDVIIETNYFGFYKELSNVLRGTQALLLATQAKCAAVLYPRQRDASPTSIEQPLDLEVPAAYSGAATCFPESPMQQPSRKRPFVQTHQQYDDDGLDMDLDGLAGAPSMCPQSPVSFPSRQRPFGYRDLSSDSLANIDLGDGFAGAPSMCPQSPVSFPSRRRPFGCRDLSSDSLAPGTTSAPPDF